MKKGNYQQADYRIVRHVVCILAITLNKERQEYDAFRKIL